MVNEDGGRVVQDWYVKFEIVIMNVGNLYVMYIMFERKFVKVEEVLLIFKYVVIIGYVW